MFEFYKLKLELESERLQKQSNINSKQDTVIEIESDDSSLGSKCWFCDQCEAENIKSIEMYGDVIKPHRYGIRKKYPYGEFSYAEISIPRCTHCLEVHTKAENKTNFLLLIFFIAAVLPILLFFKMSWSFLWSVFFYHIYLLFLAYSFEKI